jgi:hypothetical protein
MPVRGITYPIERHYYGFLERWYVHNFLPRISQLQTAGLSAHEIAREFNNRGITTAMNPSLWDAQHVLFVVRKNESICREDAIRRAEATSEHVRLIARLVRVISPRVTLIAELTRLDRARQLSEYLNKP